MIPENRILRISLALYLQCVGALKIVFRRSISMVTESMIVITMDLSLLLLQLLKMLFLCLLDWRFWQSFNVPVYTDTNFDVQAFSQTF